MFGTSKSSLARTAVAFGMVACMFSCVSTRSRPEASIKAFVSMLDQKLDPSDPSISFVFLSEPGGLLDNRILIDELTGRMKLYTRARFFDRGPMDAILQERNLVFSGILDDEKMKYLKDFWPSRYIMTGVYGTDEDELWVRLKVLDVFDAELVLSGTFTLSLDLQLRRAADPNLAAEEAASRALAVKLEARSRAMGLYRSNAFLEAIPSLIRFNERYSGDPEVVSALSRSYLEIGDRLEAIRWAETYGRIMPDSFDAWWLLGSACAWYDGERAIESIRKALDLKQGDSWVYWTLGSQYHWARGDIASTRRYWEKALEVALAKGDTAAAQTFRRDLATLPKTE